MTHLIQSEVCVTCNGDVRGNAHPNLRLGSHQYLIRWEEYIFRPYQKIFLSHGGRATLADQGREHNKVEESPQMLMSSYALTSLI